MHTIEIEVFPNGDSKLETKGYNGPSCRLADKWIRDAIGITSTDQPTAEMYSQPKQQLKQESK